MNITFFLKIPAVILICLLLSVAAHSQNSFQNWITHSAHYRLTSQTEIYSDHGVRYIFPSFSWKRLHVRPSTSYRLNQLIGIHAGIGFFQTFNTGGPNETELRPWQGLRVHGPRAGKVLFIHFFRTEQRMKWIQGEGRGATAFKIRYQLSARIPLQGNSVQVGTFYIPTFIEIFGNLGKDLEERFADRSRVEVGIGRRVTKDFNLELAYVFQISENTLENSNANVDHIITLRFRNRYNYD